jgi:hypothetical protein
MTDLHTATADFNALFASKKIPLTAIAGKRAVKFFRHYVGGNGAGYSIGRQEAMNIIRGYTV